MTACAVVLRQVSSSSSAVQGSISPGAEVDNCVSAAGGNTWSVVDSRGLQWYKACNEFFLMTDSSEGIAVV